MREKRRAIAMEAPVSVGDLLAGKYRVERVLGQGGMGLVVAARHLVLGELFAIKFLLPDALAIPDAVDRFLREARASARLKGEHVAKVHDVGCLENGAPYMVLEFLSGCDLKQLVGRRGPLPVNEAATYVIQASEAIAEAHALGIIHRDIKPANLFLIRLPNGKPSVKVLDFGISKQMSSDGIDLTKSGVVLGSLHYMSPEQMTRLRDADARSDVWAMGVVLYELVTARRPFAGETLTEVVASILQDEPAPLGHVRAGLPTALDAIVARCLQKRREHRFPSMNELAAALLPFAAATGAGTDATAGSFLPRDSHAGHASYPAAVTTLSQSDVKVTRRSQPGAGLGDAAQPGAAAVPGSLTGSTWGRTARSSGPSMGAEKAAAAAAMIGVAAIVAGASLWIVRRPGSSEAAAGPPVEVSPPAAETTRPSSSAAVEPLVTATAPATAETGAASALTATAGARAKTIPAVSSHPSAVKSEAAVIDNPFIAAPPSPAVTSAPAAAPPPPPAVTSAPAAAPPPPTTSAPPKPKYTGIY